jgi:hypothetical protein
LRHGQERNRISEIDGEFSHLDQRVHDPAVSLDRTFRVEDFLMGEVVLVAGKANLSG